MCFKPSSMTSFLTGYRNAIFNQTNSHLHKVLCFITLLSLCRLQEIESSKISLFLVLPVQRFVNDKLIHSDYV